MSLLAPLYVLGALGIGLPILFHLIRRQPRGQRRFSSLIFLRPTPPTLTRRSRLDNLLLLLIRAAALILLAAAFARPFLRGPLLEPDNLTGRRLVMLVDVSASMRRSDLWEQANQVASEVLNELEPADQIAVVSFDSKQRIEWSLEQSATVDAEARRSAVAKTIESLQPTWAASDLGDALIFAAELLSTSEVIETSDGESSATRNDSGHIIVISDMQAGDERNLKSLQAYRWPKLIKTELRTVIPKLRTNAVATILPPSDDVLLASPNKESSESIAPTAVNSPGPGNQRLRVRVSSASDSTTADFTISWASASGERITGTEMPVHVGLGENRVVQMPEPPSSVDGTQLTLLLAGDDHEFDNARYVARPKPIDQQLVFVGPGSGEARTSLSYYLQRAPLNNLQRNVLLQAMLPTAIPEAMDAQQVPLVVVAEAIDEQSAKSLKQYVSSGGRLLWVLDKNSDFTSTQASLRLIADNPELSISESPISESPISESRSSDYAMWSHIDFEHPLFKPLADARYNDFSKIRFWSHRRLAGLSDRWHRVADFDNGDPAIAEIVLGEGRLWVLTAGWQPSESQLALSTKFVPLLFGFFGRGGNGNVNGNNFSIGDDISLLPSATARFEASDRRPIPFRSLEDFAAVDQPGFYRFIDGDVERSIAVNVAESESRTQILASDELERYGVVLGPSNDIGSMLATQRQQRDIELENRQRIWQWILVAVLVLIGLESWLGGYLDRSAARNLTPTD